MKKSLTIALVLLASASTLAPRVAAGAADENGVISIDIAHDGARTYAFSKWKIVASECADSAEKPPFEPFWQRHENDGTTTFLVSDDTALANLRAALDLYSIGFVKEVNVSLTEQEQQWIRDSGIRDRSRMPAALERAQAIDNASTVDDLKAVLKADAASTAVNP